MKFSTSLQILLLWLLVEVIKSCLCFHGTSELQAGFVQTDLTDVPRTVPGVSLIGNAHVSISALLNFKLWMKTKAACSRREKQPQTMDGGCKCRNLATRKSLCECAPRERGESEREGLPLEKNKKINKAPYAHSTLFMPLFDQLF